MESKLPEKLGSLRFKSQFTKLREEGFKTRPKPWLVINYSIAKGTGLSCGWTVPRKVGKAVVRNRLKRWSREFFRTRVGEVEEYKLFLNAVFLSGRSSNSKFFSDLEHKELDEAYQKAWNDIRRKLSHRI